MIDIYIFCARAGIFGQKKGEAFRPPPVLNCQLKLFRLTEIVGADAVANRRRGNVILFGNLLGSDAVRPERDDGEPFGEREPPVGAAATNGGEAVEFLASAVQVLQRNRATVAFQRRRIAILVADDDWEVWEHVARLRGLLGLEHGDFAYEGEDFGLQGGDL